MMENPGSEDPQQTLVKAEIYKQLVVIWVGILVGQLILLPVVYFGRPALFTLEFTQPWWGPTPATTGGFMLASVLLIFFSFAFRKKFQGRAFQDRNPSEALNGLVIALVMCEGVSLFGMVLAFAFEYQYFFVWIILGVGASLFHFPKRDDVVLPPGV